MKTHYTLPSGDHMTNSNSTKTVAQPLTLPPLSFADDATPFDGDLLHRSVLARQIEQFLPRLQNGAVIAIDSQWGGGKTWFGMNWAKSLRTGGHKVAFINAFEQDYTEDPFLPIAAELSDLLDSGTEKKLLKKAAAVAGACLPVAAKVAASALSKWALGEIDIAEEYEEAIKKAEEKSEEFVKQWVERKLENHKKEQESLKGFRTALSDMATKEEKPVIVFVDELDRCRPDFAVRLIERIKHFFETPNVIFVLLIHREQLNRAIAGVYGPATDGAAYLSKFVHFFFTLPDRSGKIYIASTLRRLDLDERNTYVSDFIDFFTVWQVAAGLTMREIERGCALFAYARQRGAEGLLAYLITVKIKRPDLYEGLLQNSRSAVGEARDWCSAVYGSRSTNKLVTKASKYFRALDMVHAVQQGQDVATARIQANQKFNFPTEIQGINEFDLDDLGSDVRGTNIPEVFAFYLRQIDLPIE
ncbi:P-loop NTPase fold protein [Burkholderia pyrrocinia]|uniref:KAP family P-loop NTPase fold protein n=1 Tax=Burkholderia pyrrocinia TaxID=60550 RepID=UPI0009E064B6|nr:P-loop NTPase fold protein [Burkholderia pyrrocinia]